jgi:hypothetical protein
MKLITTPLKFLFKKGVKLTGIGLTVKELNDYRKKMIDEGKDPLSPGNFINEYGKPLYNKVKKIAGNFVEGKADGGMMEMRKKGMGLRMKDGGATFPDLSGDGKITQKDILMGRGVIRKKAGGMVKKRAKSKSKKSRGMGIAKKGGKFKGTF